MSQVIYRSEQMRQDVKSFVKIPKKSKVAWIVKDRYSIFDVVITLALVRVFIWLVGHITIHSPITWH